LKIENREWPSREEFFQFYIFNFQFRSHGFGSLQRKPADKHSQAAKQALLVFAQQVVAPVDRAANGLLAGRQVARAAGEERQRVCQAGQQRLGREQLDACRGQLDRQRQAVQPLADLGDRWRVCVRQREIRFGRPRAARATAAPARPYGVAPLAVCSRQ
jgi:hypothetical protein